MSPPSLEALMSDLSLFEEPLLKDLEKEVFTSLGEVYTKKAITRVQELLKDVFPFKMAASVNTFLFVVYSVFMYIPFIYYMIYFVILADEHVQRLYGEVSYKGGSLTTVQ